MIAVAALAHFGSLLLTGALMLREMTVVASKISFCSAARGPQGREILEAENCGLMTQGHGLKKRMKIVS